MWPVSNQVRLYVLYQATDRPWGGSNSFFRNLIAFGRRNQKIKLVSSSQDADVILTSGHYRGPGRLLKSYQLRNISLGRGIYHPLGWFKKRGRKKMVARLDGLRCFYAEKMSAADHLLMANLEWVDSVVYQSRYSKACFQSLGVKIPPHETLISNGADLDMFYPRKEKRNGHPWITLISNSWSTNPRKGFEVIAAFSELRGIGVRHIGPWPEYVSPQKVEVLGARSHFEVSEIMRTGDFLLFPAENEACPNTVFEALASGLPVLYHDSGGTPEICQQNRFGMALPKSKDPSALQDFLDSAIQQQSVMCEALLDSRQEFGFKRCFEAYIKHFEELLSL